MRSAVIALIQLLNRLLDRFDEWERKKHERKMQKERDRAENDPASYLRDEFSGVPEHKNDAEKTDKAEDR